MKEMIPHPNCTAHLWQRRLQQQDGVECVVRVCRRCDRTELCWSRRGRRRDVNFGGAADIAGPPRE
jgi:hypothetical protein